MMGWLSDITLRGMFLLSTLFLFSLGVLVLVLLVLYVIDRTQCRDAIRHNYPVIGRFRALFIWLGEFFRQYFFAMDREEMPFNRAQREWVYKSSEGADNTVAFGSTSNIAAPGSVIFVNTVFATLEEDAVEAPPVTIGPDTAHPYAMQSIINISAMSYGAISRPAVQALSRGAARAGCWLNTGEGGLAPWHLEGGCDIVFQFGTANFGVRDERGRLDDGRLRAVAAHEQVRMIEIKLSQGAKPGKGGILPGVKVTEEVARIRGIPVGQDCISPNRHHGVETLDDLLDLIARVRRVTGKPTGIKTALGDIGWVERLCAAINRRGAASAPDFLTIDSGDGGSGAAPMALIDNTGLLIREALPLTVDTLIEHGLRQRIKVIAAGKLITPAEVAWAYCAGADFVNSARGFMFAIGCIQAMRCNRNTCPTGVTTHDPRLQAGLDPQDKALRVANFVERIRKDVGIIAHSCGVPHPRALERRHARIVQPDGRTLRMDAIYGAGR